MPPLFKRGFMGLYQIFEPTWMNTKDGLGRYVEATMDFPAKIRTSAVPNWKWIPLDEHAANMLQKFADSLQIQYEENAKRSVEPNTDMLHKINMMRRNVKEFRGEYVEEVRVIEDGAIIEASAPKERKEVIVSDDMDLPEPNPEDNFHDAQVAPRKGRVKGAAFEMPKEK